MVPNLTAPLPQIRQGVAPRLRMHDGTHPSGDDGQTVWSIAAMLVEKHGIRAASFAEHQALKARQRGEPASADRWHNVAEAASAILRGEGFD
jgi:hypothetical protein